MRSYGVNVNANPVVAVLHAEALPSAVRMAPVAEHATLRYTKREGLAGALDGADVLFVYDFQSDALPDAWYAANALSWVHAASAGVDPLMFPELVDSDVTVTNSRGIFDVPIAEYVLAQILSFTKDIPESLRLQRDHTWRHRDSERIAGRSVLVVGTGPIGRAIARLLTAVGMNVSGSGRRSRTGDPDFGTVTATEDLPSALAAADFVVLAAPLTDSTHGLFDAELFGHVKRGARLINVGRGELVRTDDLVDALRSGVLAGAALDVVDPEPLPRDHPLWDLPGVVVTPHNAGDFVGWQDTLVDAFADNFRRWRAGLPLENVVDKRLGYVPSS